MAIKSKKWKAIVSFTAFFLGMTLFLTGAVSLLIMADENLPLRFQEAFIDDYQETSFFKQTISAKLKECLAIAVDGNPELWKYFDENGESWEEWNNDWGRNATPLTPEEKDRQRQVLSVVSERDKNLLFCIFQDGTRKLGNTDQIEWNKINTILPDGYNFLLYFNGEKAEVIKDGHILDIYGNGIYTRDNDWYIPGYDNSVTDDEVKNTEVYIIAKQQPFYYTYWDFMASSRITYASSSDIYHVYNTHIEKRKEFFYCSISFIVGAVLIVLYLIMRKDKLAADRWIAQKTEKLWMEWKILLCLAVSAIGINAYLRRGYWDFWVLLVVFTLSWGFYPLINDLKYNKQSWKHSFFFTLLFKATSKKLRYPISKRFSRMFLISILESILFVISVIILLLWVLCTNIYWETIDLIIILLVFGIFSLILTASLLLGARHTQRASIQLEAVLDQLHAVRQGEPVQPLDFGPGAELQEAMDDLNHIQQGFENALQEKVQSERMKVELITNVSHDIKTPLTSIISYIDLLKQEELAPDVKDYVQILEQKTLKLKEMVQDVFDISKAASHQLMLKEENLDFGKLIRQTLADMEDEIEKSPCTIRAELPDTPAVIYADGQRMYRVFQNLVQNALHYSLEGSRIYISLKQEEGYFTASIKNTSKTELPSNVDFTERFVRGDKSRTDGGSGLGLSIAKSFTEACGGEFQILTNADLFTAEVRFPKAD